MVMLVGRNGSPVTMYPAILADRLAAKPAADQPYPGQIEQFSGQQAPLNAYRGVLRLNLRQVCALASLPQMPEPYYVLEKAKQHALAQKAILCIDEPEVLAGHGAVEERVRAVLNDFADGLVFGIYLASDDQLPTIGQELGLTNLALVHVHPYTAEHTRESIKQYYLPLWQHAGYTFDKHAFDLVMDLEPGVWVGTQRKTLPYLVVDLAREAIQTAAGGEAALRGTAQLALEAVKRLRGSQAPQVSAADRGRFEHLLNEAERELRWVAAHPQLRTKDGKKELTRGHLVAQLFAMNGYEFRYPSTPPSGAP
jgi:hypothetical protein